MSASATLAALAELTLSTHIKTIFNLHTHEAALARTLRETNAKIYGEAALCWYTNNLPAKKQTIDIWCQLTSEMTETDVVACINAVLEPAGYTILLAEEGNCFCGGNEVCSVCERISYKHNSPYSFTTVHEWNRRLTTMDEQIIKLIIRRTHTLDGALLPASPISEFDLDITTLCVSPHPEEDRLIVIDPDAELADRIHRRIMRVGNLQNQSLGKIKERVTKYYNCGYAFESEDGSRLTLEEATEFIKSSRIAIIK